MLTDSLSINYSAKRCYKIVDVMPDLTLYGGRLSEWIVENLKQVMVCGGWTVTQQIKAHGCMSFQIGLPYGHCGLTSTKTLVSCGTVGTVATMSFQGLNYVQYDPYCEEPIPDKDCVFFAKGGTSLESMQNLANSLTANSDYIVTLTGPFPPPIPWIMCFEAKSFGLQWNFPASFTSGAIIQSGLLVTGAGYELQSAPPASIYKVRVTVGVSELIGSSDGKVFYDFTINDLPAHFETDVSTPESLTTYLQLPLTMWANPHSFAFFDATNDFIFPFGLRGVSIFAAAPATIAPKFDPAYCVIVAGPNNIRAHTYWIWGPVCGSLDGPPYVYANMQGYPRLLALRSPGNVPLLTPSRKPIITTAYVELGKLSSSDPTVVGQIYDGIICSDVVPDGLVVNGKKFLTVGYQSGAGMETRSTFLLCMEP